MYDISVMEYYQARLFFAYLILTILLEIPVLLLLVRRTLAVPPTQITTRRILAAGGLASLTTYPYLWYLVPALIPGRTLGLWCGETLVVIVEALVYRGTLRLSSRQCFILSLLCNLTTIILGSLMNRMIVEYRLFLW